VSDVENWTLNRDNKLRKRKGQTIRVSPSDAIPNDTLLITQSAEAEYNLILRLTVEELDALIILLQYRRTLIVKGAPDE
jgi:hypothetical protein